MAQFVKGNVMIVPFPFSDLIGQKRRPALVIATPGGDDLLLCQITSQTVRDSYAVPLRATDFASGQLPTESNIRPNKLFTTSGSLIIRQVGSVGVATVAQVEEMIIRIVTA